MLEDIGYDIETNLIPEKKKKYSYKIKILIIIFFILFVLGILLYYCGHVYNKHRIAYYGILLFYIDVFISFIFGCYLKYKYI